MLNLPNRLARAPYDRFVESMCCRPAQPISASSERSSRVAVVFQCTAAFTRRTQVIRTGSSADEPDSPPAHCGREPTKLGLRLSGGAGAHVRFRERTLRRVQD